MRSYNQDIQNPADDLLESKLIAISEGRIDMENEIQSQIHELEAISKSSFSAICHPSNVRLFQLVFH